MNMIGYLHGKITYVFADYCILDVGGVGYRVFVPASTGNLIKKGDNAEFFIHTAVREDAILLYGFATRAEYDTFMLLLSVTGIGAKAALNMLSGLPVAELTRAIAQKNAPLLTKLPGIGKKTAERIILELKDKISFDDGHEDDYVGEGVRPIANDIVTEATAALLALGYTQNEITPTLKRMAASDTVQEAIKSALKELARKD